jgi:hypothetical protein
VRRCLSLAIATVLGALAFATPAPAASPGLVVSGYDSADINRGLATGAREIVLFASWAAFQPAGRDQFDAPLVDVLATAVKQVNAAGRRVLLIVDGAPAWANGGHTDDIDYPPRPEHDQDYANFVARLVHDIHAAGGKIDRLQPWNEPDDPQHWQGETSNVDHYVSMLTKTYDAVKHPLTGAPSVRVFAASTAGHHYAWIDELLTKAGGKLDGVAVDIASSCATDGPDKLYRAADSRLGRFTFVGFVEVLKVLEQHGVPKLPLIVPIMGVSSTGGGPTSCARGEFAGKKPSGVSEAEQARLLKAQYQCLASYPQVVSADWFRLEDTSDDPDGAELNHYGLYRVDGGPKPALQAFKDVVADGGGKPAGCADIKPPNVHISAPLHGQRFEDSLDIQVRASDRGGVDLARISLLADNTLIRSFTQDVVNSRTYGLTPWLRSRDLTLGKHTLRVVAVDRNGNRGSASVAVDKVAPGTLQRTRAVRFALPKRVLATPCSLSSRCTADFGRLKAVSKGPSLPGKVLVEWQWLNKQQRWRKLVGGDKPATKALVFDARLPRLGSWRVRVTYAGGGEYKAARSKFFTFDVR